MAQSPLTGLLSSRRFLPFFSTQFLGALNDNLYKNALLILFTFHALKSSHLAGLLNLATGLFILPFFLFSAFAGQLSDKYDKAFLIRQIKLAEIFIMALGGLALFIESTPLQLLVLFFLGIQAAFFGPLKYAIIPQHLSESELIAGNAWVEMGTFVAILLGTLLGGLLADFERAALWLTIAGLSVAILGYISSWFIPKAPSSHPSLIIRWNPWQQTLDTLKMAARDKTIFLSILGISWFWLIGAAYLTQIPLFAKTYLAGSQQEVTQLLIAFTFGIAIGSLFCDRLSDHQVEIGLVPFGAIGLSIFGFDLYFSSEALLLSDTASHLRVFIDFIFLGIFGGFYIVPLYAMIQQRSANESRAQIIAANNILNAIFMVGSAILAALLLSFFKWPLSQFFLLLAMGNVLVYFYIFRQVPEYSMRFLVWGLTHLMYRVSHRGLKNIPAHGAAIVVCNHVSYVDGLLLAGAIRRPIRGVLFKPIYDIPGLNFIFRAGRAIPINSRSEDPEAYERAFIAIQEGLEQGDLLCIFPEGQLTRTGEIDVFKAGIEKIIKTTPVPVIPLALRGLWGSMFSHSGRGPFRKAPQSFFWRKVEIVAGEPVPPEQVSADYLQTLVSQLRGNHR